jgi:hypothetical protein
MSTILRLQDGAIFVSEQSFFLQRTLYRRRLHALKIGRQRNGERKAILASPHEHYEQLSISNTKTGSQKVVLVQPLCDKSQAL